MYWLFNDKKPTPPHAGTKTSMAAARSIIPKVIRDRERILSRIHRGGSADMLGGGCTDLECEDDLLGLKALHKRDGAIVFECTPLGRVLAEKVSASAWVRINEAFDEGNRNGLTPDELVATVRQAWAGKG